MFSVRMKAGWWCRGWKVRPSFGSRHNRQRSIKFFQENIRALTRDAQSKRDSSEHAEAPKWSLSLPEGIDLSPTEHPRFWTHKLYRGPEGQRVRLLYSANRRRSEKIAREFMGESVLGFDMEWPSMRSEVKGAPLQERVGLIQIACADKIGLFHIGLHRGKTPDELLAPSLRSIIESPSIKKTGVAILTMDFWRLQKFFGLAPRGAFELSHLHSLVTDHGHATTNLSGLSTQVQKHLGLPLAKDKHTRMCNWSAPLNTKQIEYAAADAYAAFMLFHSLNAKRVAMEPTPPLPVCAEEYLSVSPELGSKRLLRLASSEGHVLAFDFFPQTVAAEEEPHGQTDDGLTLLVEDENQHGSTSGLSTAPGQESPAFKDAAPTVEDAPRPVTTGVDPDTKNTLFRRLKAHRKMAALENHCSPNVVAPDPTLLAISLACPRTKKQLIRVMGVGKNRFKRYGKAWLAIVEECLKANTTHLEEDVQPGNPSEALGLATAPSEALGLATAPSEALGLATAPSSRRRGKKRTRKHPKKPLA